MLSKWSVERGRNIEETPARLAEVSEKAQERVRLKAEGYPLLTARNAHRPWRVTEPGPAA
jgi:hypothetical protein